MSRSACQTTGGTIEPRPLVAPTQESAVVYIYRPWTVPFLLKPDIRVNGETLGELPTQTHYYFLAEPGRHQVEADWHWSSGVPDGESILRVEANKTYFVRVGSSMENLLVLGGAVAMSFGGSTGTVEQPEAVAQLSQTILAAGYTPRTLGAMQ